jgi:hypothetical protein
MKCHVAKFTARSECLRRSMARTVMEQMRAKAAMLVTYVIGQVATDAIRSSSWSAFHSPTD